MKKTLRSRIAAVAVAALGFGLVQAVPAFAADTGQLDIVSSVGVQSKDVSVDTPSTANLLDNGNITFALTPSASDTYTVAVGLYGKITSCGGASVACAVGLTGYTATWVGLTKNTDTPTVTVAPRGTAGQKFKVEVYKGTDDDPSDKYWEITILSSGAYGKFSQADSFVQIVSAADNTVADSNVDTAGAASLENGSTGRIQWLLRDANLRTLSSTGVIEVNATNDALIQLVDSDSTETCDDGGAVASIAVSDGYNPGSLLVCQGDEDAPVTTTVTIKRNGTVVGVKTITIKGAASSIKVTKPLNATAGVADTGVNAELAYVNVLDSAGNKLFPSTLQVLVDSSKLNAGVTNVSVDAVETDPTDPAFATQRTKGLPLNVACSATGGSAKVRLVTAGGNYTKVYSDEFEVFCAGTPYSFTAELDKKSYAVGEVAKVTITMKDLAGRLAADGAAFSSTATSIASAGFSNPAYVTTPLNTDTTVNGVIVYKVVIGQVAGTYTAVVEIPGVGGAVKSVDLSYTVTKPAAAPDATILAMLTTLQTSIQLMMTTFTNSITKLLKALAKKK